MATRDLKFVLTGQDKSASRAMDKVGGKADGLAKKLGGIGKAAAWGVAGVATVAVGGLAAAMIQGVKDAQSYQTLQLKTAAVLKSTGNVANTTAKGVAKLAGELESLSGVDEELIINSQNVLLTFTKIRNEVGKDNKIFDRATEAALNMSVALGQDLQGAARMVGKALNDPVKGITAMGKAGITFTKQQKEQIKTLVESGKTLDAQKIILAELEVQFGGVAKAAGSGLSGSIARAKDAFGDLFRNIATPLLPKIAQWAEQFAVTVNDKVAPAIMRWIDQFERGVGPGGEFRDKIQSLAQSAADAWPHIQSAYNHTKSLIGFLSEHGHVIGLAATMVGTYAAAMKLAHVATATMAAIDMLTMSKNIDAVGAASNRNAGKVGKLGKQFGIAAAAAAAFIYWINQAENSDSNKRSTKAGLPTATIGNQPPLRNSDGTYGSPKGPPKGITFDGKTYAPNSGPTKRPNEHGNRPRGNIVIGGQSATRPQVIQVVMPNGKVLAEVVNGYNGGRQARGG